MLCLPLELALQTRFLFVNTVQPAIIDATCHCVATVTGLCMALRVD